MHERIRSVAYEWVWFESHVEIELRVTADLKLNPMDDGFDRRLIDQVLAAVRRAPMKAGGVIKRITLVEAGAPSPAT